MKLVHPKTGARLLGAAAVSGALVMGAVLVGTPAYASPYNYSSSYTGNSFNVLCNTGSGSYQAVVRCYKIGSTSYTLRYGAWVKIHNISTATCLSSEEAASGSWNVRSY
ncbi:hypothetical protein ACN6LA_001321 [Streptomyces sp. SAS_269]|uniref:hypothetical protein n=1 Tax=Streptomyces sp. SAS_269 TaxID=3412749 RepID=UPI00403C9F95